MVREQSRMIAEEFRCASAAGEKRGSQVIAITHRIADFHIDGACADPVDLQRGGGLLGKLCAMAAGIANIFDKGGPRVRLRSEEHTSELQSLMRISYAVFCLNKQTQKRQDNSAT